MEIWLQYAVKSQQCMLFTWHDAKSGSLIPHKVATSPEGAKPMSHRACFLLKRSQRVKRNHISCCQYWASARNPKATTVAELPSTINLRFTVMQSFLKSLISEATVLLFSKCCILGKIHLREWGLRYKCEFDEWENYSVCGSWQLAMSLGIIEIIDDTEHLYALSLYSWFCVEKKLLREERFLLGKNGGSLNIFLLIIGLKFSSLWNRLGNSCSCKNFILYILIVALITEFQCTEIYSKAGSLPFISFPKLLAESFS